MCIHIQHTANTYDILRVKVYDSVQIKKSLLTCLYFISGFLIGAGIFAMMSAVSSVHSERLI